MKKIYLTPDLLKAFHQGSTAIHGDSNDEEFEALHALVDALTQSIKISNETS